MKFFKLVGSLVLVMGVLGHSLFATEPDVVKAVNAFHRSFQSYDLIIHHLVDEDRLKDACEKYVSDDLVCYTIDYGNYFLTRVVTNNMSYLDGGQAFDSFGGDRETPAHYQSRTDALLVINGSFFDYGTGSPDLFSRWKRHDQCYEGISARRQGCSIGLTNDGNLISLDDSKAIPDDVKFNWSISGTLVDNGQKTIYASDAPSTSAIRTAIGQNKPGDFVIITTKQGYSISALADIFLEHGIPNAWNLDGGGSTSLVFNGKNMNRSEEEQRPVVDFFVVRNPNRS